MRRKKRGSRRWNGEPERRDTLEEIQRRREYENREKALIAEQIRGAPFGGRFGK